MQCREFAERLNQVLDERQPPEGDERLAAHASLCEPCRQVLAGQQAVLAGLRHWQKHRESPRLVGEFSRRVVARAQAEPVEATLVSARPSRRAWLLAAALVGTAAAMLLAVTIAAFNSTGGDGVVASPDRLPKAGSPVKTPGPSRQIVAKSPSAPARGSQPGAFSMFYRPDGRYGEAIADMATSRLPEAVERLDDVERYAPGIRPIRVSFTMLLDALWRAIPGMGAHDAADPSANFGGLEACSLA